MIRDCKRSTRKPHIKMQGNLQIPHTDYSLLLAKNTVTCQSLSTDRGCTALPLLLGSFNTKKHPRKMEWPYNYY